VLTSTNVTKLVFNDDICMGEGKGKNRDGRCWGVEVGNGHVVFARRVVMACGIRGTMKLVPERYRVKFGEFAKGERANEGNGYNHPHPLLS